MSTLPPPMLLSTTSGRESSEANCPARVETIAAIVLVILLLSLTAFSAPDRESTVTGSLDRIAQVKVVARFSCAALMGFMILRRLLKPSLHRILLFYTPLILFVLWAIASVSWSAMRTFSLGQTFSLSVSVLLSIIVCEIARTSRVERILLTWLLIACGIYSLSVVAGLAIVPEIIGLDRLNDGIYHPTNIGATASLGIVLTLGVHFLFAYRWSWILVATIVPLHLIALLAAKNRLSMGIALVMVLVLLVWKARRRVLPLMGATISLAAIGLLLVDPQLKSVQSVVSQGTTFVSRGQGVRQLSELSGRQEMWEKMVGSYLESPWRGHGYAVSSESGQILVWYSLDNHTAHNAVLQVLVSTGLVGLLLFAAFGLHILISCIQANTDRQRRTPMSQLMGLALIWFAGWSLLNESIFGPLEPETICFFVLTGLFVARRLNLNESDSPEHQVPVSGDGEKCLRERLARLPQEVF